MSSTSSREHPAANTLPHAGARSGSGANSVVPYIDQDEDEKPSGTTESNESLLHGGDEPDAHGAGAAGREAPS